MLWGKTKPIDKLLDGYRRFRRTIFLRNRWRYERLATEGQSPKIMVISCADSRVSPSVVFNTPPGAIFVARNIANIVAPYDPDGRPRSVGAAVEYAVKVLNVTDIVVKGHARCGGVAALLNRGEGLPPTEYLAPWIEIASTARSLFPPNFDSLSPDEKRLVSERAVIQNSIMNLSGMPWVRERLETGTLQLHGMHFDMHDGMLTRLDHESGEWVVVK